jgi:hypothetical protein
LDQQEIRKYVEAYFKLRDCNILESDEKFITVELNPETDRDLGYRPFYWTYIEKMGMKPELLKKRYYFDSNEIENQMQGDYLLFGSTQLRQIFAAVKKRGEFVRLYEDRQLLGSTQALSPWLLINYKIEYICDLKKERLLSLGFNLATGEIYPDFFAIVQHIRLTPRLPANLYIQTPVYSLDTALDHVERSIAADLQKEDDTWAREAYQRYEKERLQTLQYYQEMMIRLQSKSNKSGDDQQLAHERDLRLRELEWQYKPRIEINTVNQGVIYLHTHPSQVSNDLSPPDLYI